MMNKMKGALSLAAEEKVQEFASIGVPGKWLTSATTKESTLSKVGGNPDWWEKLPKQFFLDCNKCRSKLRFLLQIYAPIDSQHRTIYVFMCANGGCTTSHHGWRILVQTGPNSFIDKSMRSNGKSNAKKSDSAYATSHKNVAKLPPIKNNNLPLISEKNANSTFKSGFGSFQFSSNGNWGNSGVVTQPKLNSTVTNVDSQLESLTDDLDKLLSEQQSILETKPKKNESTKNETKMESNETETEDCKTTEISDDTICKVCNDRIPINTMPMIACDSCDQWYHTQCVGVSNDMLQSLNEYHCPDCRRTEEKKISESVITKQRKKSKNESLFKSFEIEFYSEKYYASIASKQTKMEERYQSKLAKSSDVEWADETYDETEMDGLIDYLDRIQLDSRQCIRYAYGDQPLYPNHKQSMAVSKQVPNCPHCNLPKRFECQLMNTVLTYLKPKPAWVDKHDWMSVSIWVCASACQTSVVEYVNVFVDELK